MDALFHCCTIASSGHYSAEDNNKAFGDRHEPFMQIYKMKVVKKRGASFGRCLLVDTQALYHLLLNHQTWHVRRYDLTYKVLQYLHCLTVDFHDGRLNSIRLSALGAVRWSLLLCVFAANKLDHSCDNALFSLHNEGGSEPNEIDWRDQFGRFEDIAVSNGGNMNEPLFHHAMNVVKTVLRTSIRKKDLELIGTILLYTFIPSRACFLAAESPVTNGTSPSSAITMDAAKEKEKEDTREYLGAHALLRVYLLRLLFSVYDDTIEDPLFSPSRLTSSDKDGLREKEDAVSFFRQQLTKNLLTVVELVL
jgi:hypothetical protein